MDGVEAGIWLVGFVAELLLGLVGHQVGSSRRLARAADRSPEIRDGARSAGNALDVSAVLVSMNRWAERQDAELRAAMLGRSKGGWRSTEQEPSWSPILATTSTNDPMWDRELDG